MVHEPINAELRKLANGALIKRHFPDEMLSDRKPAIISKISSVKW